MEFLKLKRHITKAAMQKLKRSPSLLYDCPKCGHGKSLRGFLRGSMKCTQCNETYKVPSR